MLECMHTNTTFPMIEHEHEYYAYARTVTMSETSNKKAVQTCDTNMYDQ